MNSLMRSFQSMPQPKQKMTSYMKEHYTRINPNLKETHAHLFEQKKRKIEKKWLKKEKRRTLK